MKIPKKKVKFQTPLSNPAIILERPLEKILQKQKYIAIKCHNTPVDNDIASYYINHPYYGGGSSEEWLVYKDKLSKIFDGQDIIMGPQRYLFTERLLRSDARATFNQATLDIGIFMVDYFNKVPTEMTKHNAYCKYSCYLCRNLINYIVLSADFKN